MNEVIVARFATPAARVSHDRDGAILLRHEILLDDYDRQVGAWLRRWSKHAPDRVMLAEWDAEGTLHPISYAEARIACDRLSQGLLDRGLGPDRPVVMLSEKSVAQALLTLAALQVGIPVCPISPAYSLRPEARGRLAFCLAKTHPGLVLVDDGVAYADALNLLPGGVEIVFDTTGPTRPATWFTDLGTPPRDVDAAFDAVDPDAPAKILFTSGSTGDPKPVINTQRMMCSNARAQALLFPFLTQRPPVVVDWQPWHHCGGSSHNFHAAFANGGSYYMDRGKPTTDAAYAPTLAALRAVSPTLHFGVPAGYSRLAFHLERDAGLCRAFFSRLDCLFYSAASMPPPLWDKLESLSEAVRGTRVPMVSSYGMTEMAPLHTSLHWHEGRPGMIGLPIPGSMVKLVPVDGKLELRAKGPNVTPGYYDAPALTQEAFDADGWYRSGDAVRFVDPSDPSRGLVFEGRLAEQFKLLTGTWVQVGRLRTDIVAATTPLLQDVLVAGEGHSELGLLVIPNLVACREMFGADLSLHDIAELPDFAERLRLALSVYNETNTASSRRIGRVMILENVPTLGSGEATDKGTINQRLAIQRRASLIDALYDEGAGVIRL
ncbi:MAG: AMP-binding protein [Stellaceae bacterium]